MEQHAFWEKIGSFLRSYEKVYASMNWFPHWGGLTRHRRGYYVSVRFLVLAGLYVAAFYLPPCAWSKIVLTLVAMYSIAGTHLLPTSFVFGGVVPVRPLRASEK